MKVNRNIVVALVAFAFGLFSINVQAQVDRENRSIPIPIEKLPEIDSTAAKLKIKPEKKADVKKGDNTVLENPNISNKPDREFSMIDNSNLRNPGELFEKKLNRRMVEQGIKIEKMSDQFLGEFIVSTDNVNVLCRDHEYPDGDLVRVFVNGDVIVPSLLLSTGFKGFNIPLQPGANKVEFLALNQGESGPNTAEFVVYDDNKNLVSSKRWNLLTGVKATIIVHKDSGEKAQEEEKEK